MGFSSLGLIDGISGSVVVILGIIFGTFYIYNAKTKDARLLSYLGIITISAGLLYLGVLLDFFSILFTNNNFPNDFGQVAILSYIWFPPSMIAAIYIGASILNHENVKKILIIPLILSIIFYFLIILNPFSTFHFGYYEDHTPRLIDYNLNLFTPAGIIVLLFIIVVVSGLILGAIIWGTRSPIELKKNFKFLGIGILGFGIAGTLEGFTQPGISIIIIRSIYIFSFWLMYIGLKSKENVEIDDLNDSHLDKDKEIIKYLGLQFTKPENLTKEDVKFYREQTICLVCKNPLFGTITVHICPECKALYCEKCSLALMNLENLCWSCDNPIDPKKPIKKPEKIEDPTQKILIEDSRYKKDQ